VTLAQTGVPWLESPAHIERCDEGWSWQLRGSCLAYPAELFFPEEEGRRTRRQREEQAKRICLQCPVLTACREHALKTPERYGIWGATTPRERGISSGSTRR
jgi:WhiB family transcriptional regulator, redox-sensing transcriptional regulator